MCKTQGWKSWECGHTWVELKRPCGKGYNLSTCEKFEEGQLNGVATWPAFWPIKWAPPGSCPHCDRRTYNMDKIRMIKLRATGWRFGSGPSKDDSGYDFLCCSIM